MPPVPLILALADEAAAGVLGLAHDPDYWIDARRRSGAGLPT